MVANRECEVGLSVVVIHILGRRTIYFPKCIVVERSDCWKFRRATMLLAQVNPSLQPVTLADGSTVYIQCTPAVSLSDTKCIDGQLIRLEEGSAAHHVSKTDETSGWTGSPLFGGDGLRLENGQAVQLEDGTTAYIHTPGETYGQNTLQAVQLEDGTAAYSQNTVHMPQSNTILATQADDTVSDFNDGTIDPETISVLEQYASKVEPDKPAMNSAVMETHQDEAVPMQVHKRVHTSGQPYQCNIEGCGKKYGTGWDLKSHLKTHTGETPYRCKELACGRSFRTSGQLRGHARTHTGERPFPCSFEGCGKTFMASGARKVHLRKHTGERPYSCAEPGCGRSFTSTSTYRSHIRIHTGEKPYLCTVPGCDKRFTEYSSLYKHHEVHIPFKPYSCKHCGKSYKTISYLACHKCTAHKDTEVIKEEQKACCESPAGLKPRMAHWPSDLRIVHKYFFFGGGERGRISEAIDDPPVNFSMTVEEEEPGTEQMTETEAISQQHLAPLTHNGSQQLSEQPTLEEAIRIASSKHQEETQGLEHLLKVLRRLFDWTGWAESG